jgi:hypothetical protein
MRSSKVVRASDSQCLSRNQGVTKRCHLFWLTNSALVYEPKREKEGGNCGLAGSKEVGPSTTLAWPGWKQPDISVEVDTARLETSRTEAGVLKKLRLAGIAKLSQLKYS